MPEPERPVVTARPRAGHAVVDHLVEQFEAMVGAEPEGWRQAAETFERYAGQAPTPLHARVARAIASEARAGAARLTAAAWRL